MRRPESLNTPVTSESGPSEHPRAKGGSHRGRQITARRVRDLLAASIRDGHVPRDEPLAEHELVAVFSSSRGAVRAALSDLRDAGLVSRRPKIGTYPGEPIIQIPITDVYPLRSPGAAATVERFDWEQTDLRKVPSFPLLRERLGRDDPAVMMLENTFLFDAAPIGLRTAYFAERPEYEPSMLPGRPTMKAIIEGFFGAQMGDVAVSLGAATADAQTARLLDSAVGAPLLTRDITYYDNDGAVIETVFDRYRSDRVVFVNAPPHK